MTAFGNRDRCLWVDCGLMRLWGRSPERAPVEASPHRPTIRFAHALCPVTASFSSCLQRLYAVCGCADRARMFRLLSGGHTGELSYAICRLLAYVSRDDTQAAHHGDACVGHLKRGSSDRHRSLDVVAAGQCTKHDSCRGGPRLELRNVRNDRRTGHSDGHADLRQLGTESLVNLPGLNLSTPRSVGGALPTPVTGKASYLSGSLAGSMLGALGPQTLLDNLLASLQPSSTLFYYSPQAEDLTLQQAALQQTGQASFVNGLSYDSKTGMSVTGQEKAILHQNAINYAEQNNLQLGDALSQTRSLRCPSRCCGMSSSLCPIRVAYRRV